MHHVIVGAGPAGVVAAETLRKADADCRITIVGDEPEPPPNTGIRWLNYAYAALVVWLSLPVVANLISNKQAMNRSFDRLGLVNTYGAFGGVGDERLEALAGRARRTCCLPSGSPDAPREWRKATPRST